MGTVQDSALPKNDDVTNAATVEINSNPEESDTVNNNKHALQSVSDEGGGDSGTNNNPPLSTDSKNGNNGSEISKDSDDKDSKRKNSVTQKNVPVPAISRIARPCVGHQKPAVPVTPTQIGSLDTVWETHPHRLNEAGLVRHSDNSVLTEDTNSFIIGDKIWVGGTKPGQIAYIGETQFAPGEWAGIVLDAPIGKNDGSVAGTRYFQCEPRRGVFSRLSRLTKAPLPGADESFTPMSYTHHVSSTPLNNGTRPRGASPLSPTGSTKSLRKSPSLSTSNTSLASTTHVIDFKVGDRVIVKSSQGSKVGILRYMGITSFAPGEWCGVELDEPRGKNDGSVDGIRYFECKPQFGLFAPITKISKSPLKYKPGNCVLHSGAKLPPSGMKRVGSKESMTSFTSMSSSLASAASGARRVRLGVNSLTPQKIATKSTVSNFPPRTALQDVLREKQLHIEQLLKERDLERAEFTRAANQADNAEHQLAKSRAEYEHYRAECESKLKEYSAVLSQLNVDRGSLLSQLEDEKKKNEDLQFRFEETAITKGDIEVNNQSNIHRINDLEERLSLEKQKVELLEQESSKLFEAEEELVKSREEIDSLKSNLQYLRAKRDTTAQENSISRETSSVITQQIQTKNVQIGSQSVLLDLDKQLEESRKKSTEHLQNCEKYQNEITMLKTELSRTQTIVQEQDNRIKINSELEYSLRAELERLKLELTGKNAELRSKDQELKMKDDEIRGLKTIIETTEIDLKAKTIDVERYQQSKQESEESYNKQIDYLKKMLKEKVVEKEEIEKTTTIEITTQKSKLEDASRTIALHIEEIEQLKADLIEAKADVQRNSLDVHERHTRQIAIKESELMSMAAELQQKNEEISKCSIVTTKLEDDLCIKNGMIERLKLELESFQKRSQTEERSMLNYTEQISVLQLTIGDLQRKLAGTEQIVLESQEQRARLETELENVIASSGDYSAELQKMNAAVLEKELMITTVRNELLKKLQLQQSNEQQLQLQLQKIQEDSARNDNNLKEKLRILQESEDMLRQRCESTNVESIKIRDDLMIKVNQLQRLVEEKDFALKVSVGDHTESKRYLQEQLDRTTGELQKTIDTCQYKINELSVESINSKNALSQKTQELIESEAKLKHFVAQSQVNEEELRRLAEEQAKKLHFELSEKNAQVQQFQTELELLKRDCHSRNVDIGEKDHRISELSVQLENTLKLVNQLQVEKDNLQLAQMEANKHCVVRNQQCTDLLNQVALLSEKAELGDKVAQELQMLKSLHQQLMQQLQITEKQKQDLVSRFEEEAKKNSDADKCRDMLELAKNIQASTNNEHTRKISELNQLIETTQLKEQESRKQLDAQQEEILSLQNELLSAQQLCGPNTTPSNSVSNARENKPTHTQYLLQYPPFLQVQLTNLKNSYADILQRFVGSQRLNVYLINKLQHAVSNGDTRHLHTLLGEFFNLKKYLSALRGTIEQDKFKFQKIISYALLSLHRKQVEINVQNNFIKQMQNIYNSLPIQCKLLQSNTVKGFDSELPNEAQIELEKTIQLIKVKDEHIQNLKVQLGSMQENCRKLFNTKCPIAPTAESQFINGSPSFVPSYCGPSNVIVKKVPVLQYVRQPCQQEYPDYVKNQPIIDQGYAPSQTIVQKVPFYVPRIVVKEVPRYVNEHFKCPAPQVIYQKVPVPLPPKIVHVTKPVSADAENLKLQIQNILNQCAQQCAENKNEQFAPTIPAIPNITSLINQPQEIATLKEQVEHLARKLQQCTTEASRPSFVETPSNNCAKFFNIIENQQNEINQLKDNLMSCNRQVGGLYPDANIPGNQQSHIAYLLSVIENLKSRCLASNINTSPSITNEYTQLTNVMLQHKTLLTTLSSIGRDIMQLINTNLADRAKAAMSKTKFDNLVMQVNKVIVVPQELLDLQYPGPYAQTKDAIVEQSNQLNVLRNIIGSSLPQLNSPTISPTDYINVLRATIRQFLSQLETDKDWDNEAVPSHALGDYTKCSNLLMQHEARINILRTVLEGMFRQLNNGELSELAKLNVLKAQIQNLLLQLNNNDDSNFRQCPPARVVIQRVPVVQPCPGNMIPGDSNTPETEQLNVQIEKLIKELNICRFAKTMPNIGSYPEWGEMPKPDNIFSPVLPQSGDVNQENVYLKSKIQELLMQLNILNQNCKNGFVDQSILDTSDFGNQERPNPFYGCRLKDIVIAQLRNQVDILKQQLNIINNNLNKTENSFNYQYPPPRVVVEKVPIPQIPSAEQQNEIFILKKHIQNLLMQLRFYKPAPEKQWPSPWIITPTSSPDYNENNVLKLQIYKLIQELNYVKLHPKCSLQPEGDVPKPASPVFVLPPGFDGNSPLLPPSSDNLVNGNEAQPVLPQPTSQGEEIQYLNQKIQYLLYQLNNRRCEVPSRPQAPCLPQRIEVPVPIPVTGSGVTHQTVINSLTAQVRQLVLELNNARRQIQLVENQCNSSPSWSPFPIENKEEVTYLKQQVQQLLIEINALQNRPVPIQQQNEVIYLRQQVQLLVQQLNLANRHPLIYNKQCVSPHIVISNPKPLEMKNEVLILRQRVQNLLIELQNSRLYPNCKIAPSNLVIENTAVVTNLKNQVMYLLQQLNSVGISPETLNIPCQSDTKTVDRSIPVPSPPRTIVKTVLVPQPSPPQTIIKTVPIIQQSPPKIIIRPVPVQQPPRTVIKTVYIPQPSRPKFIERPVFVQLPPKIIVRPVHVPQPSPEKTIVKTVDVPRTVVKTVHVPVPQPSAPRVIVKTVHVPQPSPPRIIVRPVPVPQPGKTIIRPVYISQPSQPKIVPVPQPSPPRIIIKTVHVPQPSPPRIIIRPVPIPQSSPIRTVIQQVPVPQPTPLKTVIKTVYVPQPSPTRTIIRPVPGPTRTVIKTVPISSPSRTIVQPLPVPQQSLPKIVPVPQPSPPRIIIKTVHVPQPSPPRIIIRPVPVPQSSPIRTIIQQVPVPQPTPPKTVIKTVYVPQPSPTRTIIRPVPGPTRTVIKTVPVSWPSRTIVQPSQPREIIRPVQVPDFQRSVEQENEINELRIRLEQLTVELNNARQYPCPAPSYNQYPSQSCTPEVITKTVPRPSPEQQQEIAIWKTQVQNLLLELKNANQDRGAVYQKQCPATKVMIERVPVYVPSSQNDEEIQLLQQQIQNLLVQLNSRSSVIEQPESNFVPTPSEQNVVNTLKIQIQNLIGQINNLQNECFNQRPSPDYTQPCPTPLVKYIPIIQQPKTLIKEVVVPISRNCNVPKVIIHNVPVPQPPRIVIKNVPVIQPPKIIIKKVLVPQGSSCPPPEVVVRKVPVFQPPKTVLKEMPIIQPPKIIIKEVPVPQAPKIKIQYVPVPVTENVKCPVPKVIIQKVPILQPPRTIIKEVATPKARQIVVKEVPVPQPPKVIIQKVPVFHKELCQRASPPTTIIKEVPVPSQSSSECNVPKYVIQQVPVVQPPKIIIKTVPLKVPPREIVKLVRVPVVQEQTCPPPQIITQRVPVIQTRTVIKEVPISQPPRIIIKQVPVPQPPQVILKKIPVSIGQNVQCPTPQVIVEKVEVPQPPRIIIKQVPVTLPPRVVVQEIPKYIYVSNASGTNRNIKVDFNTDQDINAAVRPQAVIKEVVVPTDSRSECSVPKVIIHNVPVQQPPRIIVKNVPVILPPKVIIKTVPVGPNVNCRIPEVVIRRVPVVQPARTILKQVEVPQPPRIVVKEVPVVRPQVHVKYVPVPVIRNVECPRPQVIIQKVLVPQPPRTIVTEVPVQQPPRVVVKEVFVSRPPQIIVKEVPRTISGGISPSTVFIGNSVKNLEEMRTLRLEITDLTNRLSVCRKESLDTDAIDVVENDENSYVQSLPQCLIQVQRQRIIIHKLNYKLNNIVSNYANHGKFSAILGGINKDLSEGSVTGSVQIPSQIHLPVAKTRENNPFLQTSSSLNLPLPMLNMLKSNPFVSISKPKHGLLMKVLHEAFTYTQAALSKCMNAVLIQQLATQTDKGVAEWGGDRQLLEEKEMAEGQIQFLNSIIVDMQRKSQEQQARIKLLESGYSPSAAEELNLYEVPQMQGRQRPPRVYCDICELFDDHETEDCPLQATNSLPIPSGYSRTKREAATNRSYCEICEIFGHCTEDCKEDQTF